MMVATYPCDVCGGPLPQGEAGSQKVEEVGDFVAAVASWPTRACKGISALGPLAGHGGSQGQCTFPLASPT